MTNGDCFAVKCLGDYWRFTKGESMMVTLSTIQISVVS